MKKRFRRNPSGPAAVIGAVTLAWSMLAAPLPGSLSRARAEPSPDVEATIKKGLDFRRAGRDAEALVEFQRAAKVRESPRVTAQIALAEQALGLWIDANEHLTRVLQHQEDPWIQKNRAKLVDAQSAVRSHLCQIEIWGAPTGAQVRLDGAAVGRLPLATSWVLAGSDVAVEVTAAGYGTMRRSLSIPTSGSGRAREHIELRALTATANLSPPLPMLDPNAAATGESESAAPAAVKDRPDATPNTELPATSSDDAPIYRRWWFWTAVGVVAVGAGVAGYVLTRREETCTNCI